MSRPSSQAVYRLLMDILGGQMYLTTGDIALLFGVSHRAVRHWADTGKMPYIRTPGGHRRFIAQQILEILPKELPALAGGTRVIALDEPSQSRRLGLNR